MFCPKCGKQNPDNSKFCSACGYPLNIQTSSAAPGNTAAGGMQMAAGVNTDSAQSRSSIGSSVSLSSLSAMRIGRFPLGMIIADIGVLLTIISLFTPLYKVSFFGTYSFNYFTINRLSALTGDDSSGGSSYTVFALMIIAFSVAIVLLRLVSKRKAAAIVSIVQFVLILIVGLACAGAASESYGVITTGAAPVLGCIGSAIAVFGNLINWKSE